MNCVSTHNDILRIVGGFALIWHIWWLAAASFAALLVTAIIHTFNYARDFHIPAEIVEQTEAERTRQLAYGGTSQEFVA